MRGERQFLSLQTRLEPYAVKVPHNYRVPKRLRSLCIGGGNGSRETVLVRMGKNDGVFHSINPSLQRIFGTTYLWAAASSLSKIKEQGSNGIIEIIYHEASVDAPIGREDNLRHDKPRILLIIGRHDVPRRKFRACGTNTPLIRFHIAVPMTALLNVVQAELPIFLGLVDPREKSLPLLFL
jgi:hypothetical protein